MTFKETLPRQWPLGTFTIAEVSQHSTVDDCWVILFGLVFNLTPYLSYHPGGLEILLEHAGQDVSTPFRTIKLIFLIYC